MAITKDNIKLFASERLTNDDDGGGLMTSHEIVSGVENNVFPDLSEVDRARGAVFYRKLYAAVMSPGTEALYGAHVLVDKPCSDAALSAVLVASASIGELKSDLIDALDTAGTGLECYGIKALALPASVGDRVLTLEGLFSPLIPPSALGGSVSGRVYAKEDTTRRCRPYVLSGSDQTASVGDFEAVSSVFYTWPQGGTMATSTGPAGFVGLYEQDGQEFFGNSSLKDGVLFSGPGYYPYAYSQSGLKVPLFYTPTMAVDLPGQTQAFTYAAGSTTVRTLVLPNLPAEASEAIFWTGTDGQPYQLVNLGPDQFLASDAGTAISDRAHGFIVVDFAVPPVDGGTITVRYAKKADAAALAAPASAGTDGGRQLTFDSGKTLGEAQFWFGGQRCRVTGLDGAVRAYEIDTEEALPKLKEGAIIGAFDSASGKLYLAGAGTITGWFGVQVVASASTATGTKATATIESGIRGDTLQVSGQTSAGVAFSATADEAGDFSSPPVLGHYDSASGQLRLTFSTSVKLASLSYSGSREMTSVAGQDVAGVDPAKFAANGQLQVIRESQLAVVHNTQALAPQTVAAGQTVTLPRANLADVRVVGHDGVEIFSGFEVNLTAGSVHFTTVSGYSQPVTISHRVEDLAIVQTVGIEALTVSLTRALTHDYPAGTSYLSTALLLGDLQARAQLGYARYTWDGNFDSTTAGGITADYNEAAYPLAVTDQGAITERWAVIFTNTNTVKVVGENVGEIASGLSISNTIAPLNPATGMPYFSIAPAGWGTGWATGNAYRFNTLGAAAPFWEVLTLSPSDIADGQLTVSVAARGSIDATS